ncbi:MAG: helix-turn-helix transcriptional regulator [Dongiaceae bacterium]
MSKLLQPYIAICDAIAQLLWPHAEVVLHDLATREVFYIANSYSKRRAGDSSLNEPEPAFDLSAQVIGPYRKTNWDGRRLKSVTAVIVGPNRKPAGLLCINHDVEAFAAALDQLGSLIALPSPSRQPAALFSNDWREAVNTIIGEFLVARNVTLAGLASDDLDDLIAQFARHGTFEIRKAVPYVADLLKLSRATIYNRLASLRQRGGLESLDSAETEGRRATSTRTARRAGGRP